MKRIVLLVTVALLMVAMLVGAAPASAAAGCQEFGGLAAFEAQLEKAEFGETVSAGALEEGADDDVNELKDLAC